MYDTLITDNTASILGGGLWFCPTGDATAAVTNGAAIFGNKTISRGTDNAGDDFVAVPREGEQHYITLADRMLGGGEVCWYRDGGVSSGEAGSSGGQLGAPDGSPRYDPDNPGERMKNIELPKGDNDGIALKAVTSEAARGAGPEPGQTAHHREQCPPGRRRGFQRRHCDRYAGGRVVARGHQSVGRRFGG